MSCGHWLGKETGLIPTHTSLLEATMTSSEGSG